MNKRISHLILIIVLLFMVSCSLDRKNPLDPQGNSDMQVPPDVTGLLLSSSNMKVNVKWNRLEVMDKYYIYRSLSHDGDYDRIAEINNSSAGEYLNYLDSDVVLARSYYYKVSGVIKGLEGHISNYQWIRVKQ